MSKTEVDYLDSLEKATKGRYLIEGGDPFLRLFWLREIASKHGIALRESKIELDASKCPVKEITNRLSETDLFSAQHLVVVDNVEALAKKDTKQFIQAFAGSPSVVVGFIAKSYKGKKSGKSEDPGEKKLLTNLFGKSHVLDARKKSEYGVLEWIRKRTTGLPLRANQDSLIAGYAGTDIGEVESAIEKVRLALKGGPLSNADLRDILNCRRSISIRQAAELLINGRFEDAMRLLDSVKKTQTPKWFLKNFEELIRKAILAKEIKGSGRDPKLYAQDFGSERKFQRAWEIPISRTNLVEMYVGLLPFFNENKYATWDEVMNYVYKQKSLY